MPSTSWAASSSREVRTGPSVADGRVALRFRHQVDGLATTAGTVDGVTGTVLAASDVSRGRAS